MKAFPRIALVAAWWLACSWPAMGQQRAGPPLVEQECAYATYLYLPGQFNFCVARNRLIEGRYEQGVEMLELASSWASKPAQQLLGVMYFNGDAVPRDRALGLAWLQLAAERGDAYSLGLLQSAMNVSTAAERTGALAHLARMQPRYADSVAAVRADNRYRRFMRHARAHPGFGGGKCIFGLNTRVGAGAVLNPSARQEARLTSGDEKRAPPRGCTMAMEEAAIATMETGYRTYFRNWKGKVVVHPLQQVP